MNEKTVKSMIEETQQFLRHETSKLDQTGMFELELSISSNRIQACAWSANRCRFKIGQGKTIEEAFSELRKLLPDTEAQQMRNEAAELIERANRLEAK